MKTTREIRVRPAAMDALATYALVTGQGPKNWPVRDLGQDYVGVTMPVVVLDALEDYGVDIDDPDAFSRWMLAAVRELDDQ